MSGGNRVFHDGYHPNADKWTTSRTLSLTGGVTGSVTWDGSANATLTSTVALATASAVGGIKIGYAENGKNYPVELDSNGKAYVNVPWTDTNTDTNTTYSLKAQQTGGNNTNPNLLLDANSGTDDTVQLVGSGATTVTRNSDGQITISSTDTNTDTNQLTTFVVQDGDSTNVTISQGKYLKFAEGGAIDVNFTDTSTGSSGDPYDLTISHADTSSQASVDNSNGTVIQDVTLDTYGHVTGLGAVNLDGRYYTESEINTFINRSYVSKHSASELATGWYTIAQNTGDRAVARFALWDTKGGRHQSVIFYAAHHFGTDSSNTLTVLDNAYYSGNPFRYIRIKDAGTYDGAALQVYIDDAANSVNIAIVGDDVQSSGWDIVDFLADATAPSQVSNWANFGERAKVDLNQIAQGGLATTGPIYADGNTTQYRVFNDNYHPNADAWTTGRTHTVTLTGAVTGTASQTVDGSGNKTWTINTTQASTIFNWVLEDGDGTEVNITDGKEVKFVEAGGININWTDTSTGSDGDPYDLSFNVTSAPFLTEDDTVTYGSSGLQWFDVSGNGGPNGNNATPSNPTNDWYHHIIANHGNNGGYYVDIAQSFHSDAVYHRRLTNGSLGSWQRFFTDAYHPNADKWTTARTLSLTGEASGSVSWDGSGNASLSVTLSNTALDDQYVDVTGDTMTGQLKIDTDNQSGGALRIENNVTNTNNDFYFAQEIVQNLSGTQAATGDREQGGLWMDINSTNTGGDTSNEHRAYGIYLDVDSTGDADAVTGIYSNVTATPTTGTSTNVWSGYFWAEDNGGAGNVSNVYGIQSFAYSDNSNSDTDNMYAGYFKAYNAADTGNIGSATAVYGELEIPSGSGDHYGNSYVFRAEYDNNDTVAQTNTTYLFYGNYAGVTPTSAYGLYIADSVWNYMGGSLYLGDRIAHVGDTDTYMQFSGDNQWRVVTAGSQRFFIDSDQSTFDTNVKIDSGHQLYVGDGADDTRIHIKKADNNVSDHLIFYNGTSRVGEIGCQDTTWLRINQSTAKNIYTPRMIRADAGFQATSTICAHVSDTNTYLQFHANDQFRVVVGGSERLEVKNSSPHVLVTGDLNSTSDARLKENVEPIANALSDITQLEGVSFDWKDTGTRGHGFIAQQVEPILPDVVNTDDETGIKSINYVGMIGHLVEAIKEQQKQIDALTAQVEELKR